MRSKANAKQWIHINGAIFNKDANLIVIQLITVFQATFGTSKIQDVVVRLLMYGILINLSA